MSGRLSTSGLLTGLWHGWVVFRKEVLDYLRDRRSMLLALIYPLVGPVLLSLVLILIASLESQTLLSRQADGRIDVPVAGAHHAPQLLEFLMRHDVVPHPAPPDPEQAVREGGRELVLVIPPEAADNARYKVRIISNLAEIRNTALVSRVRGLILRYGDERARQTLAARGVDPAVLEPIEVEAIGLGQEPNLANVVYRMIPPLAFFTIFMGALFLAIDTTAGERERGSLEPLLTLPVERWSLLLGKSAAALLFTVLAVSINVAAFSIFLSVVAGGRANLAAPPSPDELSVMFLIALPVMVLAVSVQMLISAITRSIKEAQIYLGLLPAVPTLPGVIMVFSRPESDSFVNVLPVLGQLRLVNLLLRQETLDAGVLAGASVSTVLLALLLFAWATRQFSGERLFR